ncbi:SAICAR synthase-like protein, partial [Neoconidiobolus thromboides FSU 785]
ICLENLLSGYKQPNVLDLKIGTILADHLATEEKKERMRKRAQETTSFEMGIRVTGMKVYNNATKEYRDYDREYGVNLTKDTMINAFKEFFPKEIDTELRNCIIQGFISEITDLTGILKTLPISMAASSLLFVYEGDNKELRKKIEEYQLDYNSEDEDNEEEEEEQEQIPPFRLRLIDFAHSFWLPPKHELDKGCFLGLKNTVDFLGKLVEESN